MRSKGYTDVISYTFVIRVADEEGFLSAEQEPDCELRVYSAAGEVTDDGTSQ